MPFVSGFLRVRRRGHIDNSLPGVEGPVDPDYGIEEGRPDHGFSPDYPSQGLPGRPEYPSQGPVRPPAIWPPIQGPVDPGWGFPLPPVIEHPIPPHPGQPLPVPPDYPSHPIAPGGGGEAPDQGLPSLPDSPSQLPSPPPTGVWPPTPPLKPGFPIYPVPPTAGQLPSGGGGSAGQLPAAPPGAVWPPLPPDITGKVIAFCWLVGVGYRWVVIDPGVSFPIVLPKPPTAQPK